CLAVPGKEFPIHVGRVAPVGATNFGRRDQATLIRIGGDEICPLSPSTKRLSCKRQRGRPRARGKGTSWQANPGFAPSRLAEEEKSNHLCGWTSRFNSLSNTPRLPRSWLFTRASSPRSSCGDFSVPPTGSCNFCFRMASVTALLGSHFS